MSNQKKSLRPRWSFPLALLVLILGLCTWLSQGPDLTLTLTRDIRSSLSPEQIARNFSAVNRWPQWFHSLDRVEPISPLQTGDILTLKIDPHKGKRKQFQLTAQVLNYVPDRLVSLKITQDSSGRLTQLFDEVEWKIEIMPQSQDASRSIIEGTVTAHTRHWRARFFGRIAEKILMNQIFYPNLIQLSEMRQPFSVDPAPHMPPTL